MITQLNRVGLHASNYRKMKADAHETFLVIGVTLFWAAVLPVAFLFFSAAALWDSVRISLRQGPPKRWAGVLHQFELDESTRRI